MEWKPPARIDKDTYYKYMQGFNRFDSDTDFKMIRNRWYACFAYSLRYMQVGYREQAIQSLFFDWEMSNWDTMNEENTEYSGLNRIDLYSIFCNECIYICDRMNYDRLFNTHWLYRRMFSDEIWRY